MPRAHQRRERYPRAAYARSLLSYWPTGALRRLRPLVLHCGPVPALQPPWRRWHYCPLRPPVSTDVAAAYWIPAEFVCEPLHMFRKSLSQRNSAAAAVSVRGEFFRHSSATRGTRFYCRAFTPQWGASALFCMLRGDGDANTVYGFGDGRRHSGGGHVDRSDGEIPLRAGLHISSRRLPT